MEANQLPAGAAVYMTEDVGSFYKDMKVWVDYDEFGNLLVKDDPYIPYRHIHVNRSQITIMENNFPLVGKIAKITANTSNHKFAIGMVVVLDCYNKDKIIGKYHESILPIMPNHGTSWFFLDESEYELIDEKIYTREEAIQKVKNAVHECQALGSIFDVDEFISENF